MAILMISSAIYIASKILGLPHRHTTALTIGYLFHFSTSFLYSHCINLILTTVCHILNIPLIVFVKSFLPVALKPPVLAGALLQLDTLQTTTDSHKPKFLVDR